ncbi:dNA ligase NAD-dependent [Clostridium sp. CAG:299]|nr:dNA ligase NAD-dependent [Clostridium sp. CAG:299]
MLCRHFKYDFQAMRNADKEELVAVDGIGEVLAEAWIQFFQNEKNNKITDRLLAELLLPPAPEEEEETGAGSGLAGLTFVITGSVERFKNRKELQELIEERGGKVTGSVTAKTSYLINNDSASSSSKNKKARELNIPIITEDEFIGQFIPGSSAETA